GGRRPARLRRALAGLLRRRRLGAALALAGLLACGLALAAPQLAAWDHYRAPPQGPPPYPHPGGIPPPAGGPRRRPQAPHPPPAPGGGRPGRPAAPASMPRPSITWRRISGPAA